LFDVYGNYRAMAALLGKGKDYWTLVRDDWIWEL